MDLSKAVLLDHARQQLVTRQLSEEHVRQILAAPLAVHPVRRGRIVAQGIVAFGQGKKYLVRVFIDVDRNPPEVVTAYRTSKIKKYG